MTPKVLLVATGGTISTVRDPSTHKMLRRATGEELPAQIPGIEAIVDVEIIQFDNVASMDVTPGRVMEIAAILQRKMQSPNVAGAVVTIGTDTMEEAAYLLDLVVDTSKPVVVTGAMRGGGLLGEDGIRNLQAAVLVAAHPASTGKGVTVVLNDEIHAASLVTKSHSLNPATFRSLGKGPIGEIWGRSVHYHFSQVQRRHIATCEIEPNVDLIRVVLGMDGRFARASIDGGARGIVVETAGAGAITPELRSELKAALDAGIVLGITTRCPYGGPAGFFGDAPEGVFEIPDLSGAKARLLLMAALGYAAGDKARLREAMRLG